MKLNELHKLPGTQKRRIRVGRGIGSGKGKTCGRGHKGQKSRAGVSLKGLEGGQMPLYRRLPKRGFVNPHHKRYALANLGKIQKAIDKEILDPTHPITYQSLKQSGIVTKLRHGVRLLAQGTLSTTAHFTVDSASASAIKAIEAIGGTVTLQKSIQVDSASTSAIEAIGGTATLQKSTQTAPTDNQ